MTLADAWRALLPSVVRVVPATEAMWSAPASARESLSLERAVMRRRREFQAGRAAARTALRAFGVDGFDLLPGTHGEPLWPDGFVGSITHTAGHCAAAVARCAAVAALGIDAERASALRPDVAARVCRAVERSAFGARDDGLAALIVFSAKESVFKACFPHTGRFLDFDDVTVTLLPAPGRFVAELAPDVPPLFRERRVAGRFAQCDGLVLTAVAIGRETAEA